MKRKQTAVEWLAIKFSQSSEDELAENINLWFGQAKAMEKEQIIDANEDCSTNELGELLTGEQYYTSTYE
jgi:lauroyl/myristoyl acyltransferase